MELVYRYGYIYKPLTGGSWYSADEKWALSDSEILKAIACAHPKYYIGYRAGKSTRFAVLDIDAKSKYHNKRYLYKLLQVLVNAGLTKSSLYRSSDSGGWHLYIFFDEPISSADLRRQLVKLLTLHDFDIAKGMLEVFPHPGTGSLGMGLRLPLQPGWAWLNKETLEVEYDRRNISATTALELFIDALDGDANSYASYRQLKSYIEELELRKAAVSRLNTPKNRPENNLVRFTRRSQSTVQSGEFIDFVLTVFHQLPPGIIPDNWYKGRAYHLGGLSGPSQRAEAIICLGHYLFYGDPSRDLPALGYGYEQEREWAIREFLALKHNGQSEDINRDRPDALAQIERAAHWRPAHNKGGAKYSVQRPIAWVRENANRKIGARKKIQDALEKLLERKRPFSKSELQAETGSSWTTIYKHKDIWGQAYEDLAAGFFETSTHEYNVVGGAACPESKPPLSLLKNKNTPPGLLAARQVAYEISMRAMREKKQEQVASVQSITACEIEWRTKVATLVKENPENLSVEKIKVRIVVLSRYLSIAPDYDEALSLESYIQRLRAELVNKTQHIGISSVSVLPLDCSGSSFDEVVSSDSFP